jgi:hypothetical protein
MNWKGKEKLKVRHRVFNPRFDKARFIESECWMCQIIKKSLLFFFPMNMNFICSKSIQKKEDFVMEKKEGIEEI